MDEDERLRVFLLDDHEVVRDGLRMLIEASRMHASEVRVFRAERPYRCGPRGREMEGPDEETNDGLP